MAATLVYRPGYLINGKFTDGVFLQMMNRVKVVPLRTMNVAMAIAEYSNFFGAPSLRKRVAVTGTLIVTSTFSYLVTHRDDLQGVFIPGRSIFEALFPSSVEPIVGGMVVYQGAATCVGCVGGTTIPMFPVLMDSLSEFTFQDEYHDPTHFTLFHPSRSLFIHGYTHLRPQQIKVLWQLLGKPANILHLRPHLCDGGQHLLQSDLSLEALEASVCVLQAAEITNLTVDYTENAD